MRTAPSYIADTLRDYDPGLSIIWDNRSHVWMFRHKEKPLFAYKHADGSFARNVDGNLDEIMRIVRKADWHNRDRMLRRQDRIRSRVKDSIRRTEDNLKQDAARESGKIVKCSKRGGAKPFADFSSLKKN